VNFASFDLWVAGDDGVLYGIDKDKTVTYFRLLDPWRNKGPMRWSPDSNTVIGKLSKEFARVAGMSRPIWTVSKPDGAIALEREWETGLISGGTLFALDDKGETALWQHGWSSGGKPAHLIEVSGWFTNPARADYKPRFRGPRLPPREKCVNCQLLEGGTGITFTITPQGNLLRYRQRAGGEWAPASGKFARGPFGAQIGHEWQMFRSVVAEPGAYRIEGYVSTERPLQGQKLATMSVEPGETVKVRASTFSPVYSVRLLRLQRSRWEDSGRGSGLIDGSPVGAQVKVETPAGGNFKKQQSNEMYFTGTGWPGDGGDVPLPRNAPSGIYAAELTTPGGGRYLAPFVVRPPRSRRNQIAVIANTTTWNGYNQWGGGSRFVSFQRTPARPYELSYERPQMDAPLFGGVSASPGLTNRGKREFNQLVRAEVWVISVLDSFAAIDRKYGFDVFSDVDLHAGIDRLADYKVLILQTLPLFWTDRMRDNLEAHLASGGHLIYLGGRGLSERVVISSQGKLQLSNGPGDGCTGEVGRGRGPASCPALNLFRWQSQSHPDGRSERAVLGIAQELLSPPIDFANDGDYFTIWRSHPFLSSRTGLARGARLGDVRGVNANLRAADGESNGHYPLGYCPEISNGRCSATHTTLAGDLLAVSPGKSEMPTSLGSIVFRATDTNSGWVFSIGSLSVGGVLAIDPTLQQILRNALDAGLEGVRPSGY
jgi:hypothetical protein